MKRTVAIVGGGASALMLAAVLDPAKFTVTIYERNAALGRKFLVAGDGGFNLTHAEPPGEFIQRYTPAAFLEEAFNTFNNMDLIRWLAQLGIETYTGSSGRVFPMKGIKPVEVLNAFLRQLSSLGVHLRTRCVWTGFSHDGGLTFEGGEKVKSDITVFALGGGSWPVTGSRGDWLSFFEARGVEVVPLAASNCSVVLQWPQGLGAKLQGKALKNIEIRCGSQRVLGEVVITRSGLEGSGIYPLSPVLRDNLQNQSDAKIHLDLKPALSTDTLVSRIANKRHGRTLSEHLAGQLHLSAAQLQLLKSQMSKEEFTDPLLLAQRIKNITLTVTAMGPLEKAISSVGGISLNAVDAQFQLRSLPGAYAIGEMLNYDAPTGGYLLQSCFSMAHYLGEVLNKQLPK